ncbi:MAG: amidohydrolase family protein [Anaerolineales bacterium]
MRRNIHYQVRFAVLFIFLLIFISACTQTSETPHPQSPSTSNQPADYIIRIELTSTTVWADLRVLSEQDIISAELVSVSGEPTYQDASPGGQAIDQPIDDIELGSEVGITVDYRIKAEASENGLAFRLQRDNPNGCTVRIFHVVGEEAQLVYKLDHQDAIEFDDKNTIDFTLDLKTMAIAIIDSPPQTLLPAADAASIIFHNGYVITLDEENHVFEAIAIKGNEILAVGTNDEILALQGEDTTLIDLSGQTLLPGFIDGHTHILIFPDRMGKTLDDAIEVALSLGYTSVTEMVGEADFIEILQLAEQEGRMRLRVNLFTNINQGYLDGDKNILVEDSWSFTHAPILDHDKMVRVPGIKIFVDGAGTEGRGCPAMRDPYPQETQNADWFKSTCFTPYGDLYWEQEELNQVVDDAQAAGFRVAFHAMGDKAIEAALDAIEYALDGESNEIYRHQIQHNSVLDEDLMDRYVSMDMLGSLRGYFPTCYQADANPVAGNRYALPGLGVHAYLETDFGWTVDPNDKYAIRNPNSSSALYSLVTHKQTLEDGTVCNPEPWLSQRVITVEQALRIMTIEGAYAVSQEDYLGSLEPGKFADIIILSDNPLTTEPDDLQDLEVWMTMVAGNTEYCAPGQEEYCP